jgi:hypothetical protein
VQRYILKIGDITYTSKKAALEFYRKILNKYEVNNSISDLDFSYLIDLFNYSPFNIKDPLEKDIKNSEDGDNVIFEIDDIVVNYHPIYKKTKCFYFIVDEENWLFSYISAINGSISEEQLFCISCRNAVKEVLRNFKIEMFKKRPVKCAITKKNVEWENCHVDHKSPMTFSVIVKTFLKSFNIEISNIDFSYEDSFWHFNNLDFKNKFIEYHNKVALLRIISSEENLKLAAKARIKPSKNDYILNP